MSTRTQSTRPTLTIPVEIWQICWTNAAKRDCLALSTTCKLFYGICRPLLFLNLIYLPTTALLDENLSDEDYKIWETSVVHFDGKLKWLASDPSTTRYPRFCMFSGIPDEDLLHFGSQHPKAVELYHSLLATFKASVGSFTNLREIRLEDIEVDEEIARCLHKLPLLQDIYLQSVKISCHSSSPLIQPTQLSILEWEPRTQFTPEPLELFSNKNLTFVEIQSYQYASPCLQHFTSQGTSEVLTTLKIILDVNILPTLFAFLETCPRLTTLGATVVNGPENFRPIYPTLSSSALPDLHWYEGVASLASVVVPGRPVHSIIIKDTWEGSIKDVRASSVLHDLAKSSVAMRGISLPRLKPHPDIFDVISKLFPKLEKLQLNFTMTEEDLLEFPNDDRTPDDEYFDMTVPTEVSSIPVGEDGCPVRAPTSMKGVIYWLCLNKLPLPPTLTKLAFIQRNHLHGFQRLYKTCLSFQEQYQSLELLASHSRKLDYVVFGGQHMHWVVDDNGKWKPGKDYAFYMGNRWQIVGGRRPNAAPDA